MTIQHKVEEGKNQTGKMKRATSQGPLHVRASSLTDTQGQRWFDGVRQASVGYITEQSTDS